MLCTCTIIAATFGMSGCGKEKETNSTQETTAAYTKQDINVAVMKGPTAIGMVSLMNDNENENAANNYTFTVAGSADEFTSQLIKGDIQIAALPCNAAATLYNKSNGKIQIAGINTLGVLYILQNGSSIEHVNDLKGKTIYATGKGTTPEYTLRYMLKSAGIDPDKDVNIEFKSEATEVAALMTNADDGTVAMLPQPYVSTVMQQNSNINIAIDVTAEWENHVKDNSTVVTGVIVVNKEYADKNPEAVKKFIEEYRESVEYVNNNVEQAAEFVEEFGIFKADIAEMAIPYCNIILITGSEMKDKINAYLNVLYNENPDSVGGKLPGDDCFLMLD